VADEFDRIHSVQRAQKVGALHKIIPPATLRPYLIHAIDGAVRKDQSPQENEPAVRKGKVIESAA